jgi:hypothetical protein
MAEAEILAGTVASNLFEEWAQFIVGQWVLTGPTPDEQRTATVTRAASDMVVTNNKLASGVTGHAVTVPDSASGMIRQTESYDNGITEVTYINKVSSGRWAWRQTRILPDGTHETNIGSFNIGAGANSALYNVSNRIAAGKSLPNQALVLSRVG